MLIIFASFEYHIRVELQPQLDFHEYYQQLASVIISQVCMSAIDP